MDSRTVQIVGNNHIQGLLDHTRPKLKVPFATGGRFSHLAHLLYEYCYAKSAFATTHFAHRCPQLQPRFARSHASSAHHTLPYQFTIHAPHNQSIRVTMATLASAFLRAAQRGLNQGLHQLRNHAVRRSYGSARGANPQAGPRGARQFSNKANVQVLRDGASASQLPQSPDEKFVSFFMCKWFVLVLLPRGCLLSLCHCFGPCVVAAPCATGID